MGPAAAPCRQWRAPPRGDVRSKATRSAAAFGQSHQPRPYLRSSQINEVSISSAHLKIATHHSQKAVFAA